MKGLVGLYEREVSEALAKVSDATTALQRGDGLDWFDAQAVLYGVEQLQKVVALGLARQRGERPKPLLRAVPAYDDGDETVAFP